MQTELDLFICCWELMCNFPKSVCLAFKKNKIKSVALQFVYASHSLILNRQQGVKNEAVSTVYVCKLIMSCLDVFVSLIVKMHIIHSVMSRH